MHGSLALHRGLLFVGRHARTAEVRAYDLDGRLELEGFSFRDERTGRSTASGLDLDDEGRIWIADTPASRLRGFSVFGKEVAGLGISDSRALEDFDEEDRAGLVRSPVDVCAQGDSDGLQLVVAGGGVRRHGVQVFDENARLLVSLRPMGNPRERFHDITRIARRGRLLFVVERGAGRIQVFRDFDFHFSIRLEEEQAVPVAIEPLEDGRVVVGCTGERSGIYVCDVSGRILQAVAAVGDEEGAVTELQDLVVLEAGRDRETRILALDLDGERVQVFTLEGRCYGAFQELA